MSERYLNDTARLIYVFVHVPWNTIVCVVVSKTRSMLRVKWSLVKAHEPTHLVRGASDTSGDCIKSGTKAQR